MKAQGEQESQILQAEGRKQAQIAQAQAEAEKLKQEGEGRATAVELEGRANAEKIRALGLAEAEKLEAGGLAEAKATEAQGLAEAKAIMEKAAAWREFNDAARLQTILEKLPEIIESAAPVFQAVAEPLGSIDKVVMIDNGNGSDDGKSSGLNRFAQTSPNLIFNLLQQMQALGLSLPEVLSQLGIEQKDGKFSLSSNGDEKKDKAVDLNDDVNLELDNND